MKTTSLILPALILPLTLFSSVVRGQEDPNPVCLYQSADPEGDGYGWENSRSCVVTDESSGPPTFTNRETGRNSRVLKCAQKHA